MKKGWKVFLCTLLAIVIICGGIFAFAYGENPVISADQTLDGDFITAASDITNEGHVTGDFICAAQNLNNNGTVEGDIIAVVSSHAALSGNVRGSVRILATDINLSGLIERNVMIASEKVVLDHNSNIGRNAYIVGSTILSEGIVRGDLTIVGESITLAGTYEGNVTVNNSSGKYLGFKVLPGTVIKGKLTYQGADNYELPADVIAGEYEFIRTEPSNSEQAKPGLSPGKVIKQIITMLIFYLFALMIYKLFPRFFVKSGELIRTQPLNAAGVGVATFGCLAGGGILLILLLILIVLISNLSVLGYLLLIYIFIIAMAGLLATIPVSMWLGNIVSNGKSKAPGSLIKGLAIITFARLLLDYLKTLNSVSGIAGVVLFIINAAIWVFGTGAVIKTIFSVRKAANTQAETEFAEEYSSTDYDTFI